jgi:cyclic pyranopterin phosphate synthase
MAVCVGKVKSEKEKLKRKKSREDESEGHRILAMHGRDVQVSDHNESLIVAIQLSTKAMKEFTHINEEGKVNMVDVGGKAVTQRTATARSIVYLPEEVLSKLVDGDIQTKKGSVFQTAIIAGIMAAKKTGELIPLCHPLGLDNCNINISINEANELVIDCVASITAKTGIEMEALVGASIAALTVYDMCKALSHDIVIKETKLMEKKGGKNDFKRA